VWLLVLTAAVVSLVNLTLLTLAAAGLVRLLVPRVRPAVLRSPFRGSVTVLGTALLSLLATSLLQIAVWAAAFVVCGEFADPEDAFYHSAVNFTTLGYGDIVMSRRWRLLGPLEALNGSLMLGLSAAMLFTVLGRVADARRPPPGDANSTHG
jgi:hypothetical protein